MVQVILMIIMKSFYQPEKIRIALGLIMFLFILYLCYNITHSEYLYSLLKKAMPCIWV